MSIRQYGKKAGAVLLTLVMLLGLMPWSAMPARAGVEAYPLWVGGIEVTEENAANITGAETAAASYDFKTNTLMLNGYSFDGAASVETGGKTYSAAILWLGTDALTIAVSGRNTVTESIGFDSDREFSAGIFSGSSDLTITGGKNDSLTVTTDDKKINNYAVMLYSGSLTVAGDVTLECTGSDIAERNCQSFGVSCGNLTVTDGAVAKFTGGNINVDMTNSYGALCDALIVEKGATAAFTGGNITGDVGLSYGVYCNTLTLSGENSRLESVGGAATQGSTGIYCEGGIILTGSGEDESGTVCPAVTAKGGAANASYGVLCDRVYVCEGCALTAEGGEASGENAMSCGVHGLDNGAEIYGESCDEGGEVTAKGGRASGDNAMSCGVYGSVYPDYCTNAVGVHVYNALTLTAEGGEASGENAMSCGIRGKAAQSRDQSSARGVEIEEDAVVDARGESYGVFGEASGLNCVYGVAVWDETSLTAEGGSYGVRGDASGEGKVIGIDVGDDVSFIASGASGAFTGEGEDALHFELDSRVYVNADGTGEHTDIPKNDDDDEDDNYTYAFSKFAGYKHVRIPALTKYPLWVGGTRATSDTTSGTGWSYDAESKTLTLDNYSYSGSLSVDTGGSYKCNAAIIWLGMDKLKVELKNTNSVVETVSVKEDDEDEAFGIYASKGGLSFTGTGSLSVTGSGSGFNSGIYCESGDITVSGGARLTVEGGTASEQGAQSFGVFCENLTLSGSGSSLTATGGDTRYGSYGVHCYLLNINDGTTLTAEGETMAISGRVKNTAAGMGFDGSTWTVIGKSDEGQPLECLKAAFPKLTVSFDANDGTTVAAEQNVPLGFAVALTANTFTRAGYEFAGWNTEKTPTTAMPGTAYDDMAEVTLTEGVTLYAQWTMKPAAIEDAGLSGTTLACKVIGVSRSARLAAAWYDGDGRLLGVKVSDTIAANTASKDIAITGVGTGAGYTYRLMLVDEASFAPLCPASEVPSL